MIPGHFLSSGVRTEAFTLCISRTLTTVEYASEIHHPVEWVAIYGAEEMWEMGRGRRCSALTDCRSAWDGILRGVPALREHCE